MTGTKINVFKGIRPRIPESLLAEHEATVALNCDFAYGELRNTKDGFAMMSVSNTPASIYTDDGLAFYTWPTDVDAVRSPLVSDTYYRLYYTGNSEGFKVADRRLMKASGGVPTGAYYVGTHRPTAAPAVAVATPDPINSTTADIVFKFHYEYGGVKYQEQTATPTSSTEYVYAYTPPTMADDTPATAFPVVRMTATWKRDNSQVFDLYTSNSSFASTGGMFNLTMAKDSADGYEVTLDIGIQEADKETRAYVYTQVNTYGEEGPPSDPSLVTTSPIVPVTVTVTKNQLPGYAPIKEIRIYRTGTGTVLTDYYYVGSIDMLSVGTATFNDNIKAEMLNEPLSSNDYYPPNQSLRGLMSLPNGILCAWNGNEIHFSEAYKPWAWPPKYVKTLPHAVVGGLVHGAGAVITTTGQPYLVSGVSPDSMTTSKINVTQAGVSKWSIAVVDGTVVYASNDGLVTIVGATANLNASQKFFTREVWRARCPSLSTMRFAVWDGRLVVYSSTNAFAAFMLRMDEAQGTMTDLPSLVAKCSFVSVLSDQFYYTNGQTMCQFNGGSAQEAVWQSRELVIPAPVNFGAAQAVCEGTWKVEFFAYVQKTTGWEFKSVHTQALTGGTANFRLPSGYESDRYKVKITGSGKFRELRVAITMRELARL